MSAIFIGKRTIKQLGTMKRFHVSLPTILSDKPDVIEFLARYYPHFDVSEKNFDEDLMKMLTSKDLIQLSNVMEIMASACVMLGEEDAIKQGALLWKAALFFRNQINATKVYLKKTSFEEIVFKQKREVTANIDLMDLEGKSSVYLWKLQALIIAKRVSFYVHNLFNMCLQNWKIVKFSKERDISKRFSQLSRAFFAGNYLLELFETECYFRVIKSDPVPSFEVITSTYRNFLEVLMDPHWGTTLNTFSADQEISKPFKYVLKSVNFENLLFALRFCANLKLKLQDYFQTSVQKIQIHNVIYDLILALLVLLMSLPKQLSTKQQRN